MNLNYRYLIIKNFIVFYRYENDEVFILRILNSKRDYLNILLKPKLQYDMIPPK